MPEARAARRNAWVVAASACSVVVFLALFLFFAKKASDENARTRAELHAAVLVFNAANEKSQAANRKTSDAVIAACRRSNINRRLSNQQLRGPLKEMFRYFVTLVNQQIVVAAKGGAPLANAERTFAFKEKFERFYRQVTLLPQVDCKHPDG